MELNSNSKNTDPVLTDVPPVPPAHWTPTRREISAWLHEQAPPLAELYEGAVCLIFERPIPGTVRFVAHAVREIRNRLPDYISGSNSGGGLKYKDELAKISKIWQDSALALDEIDAEASVSHMSSEVSIPRQLFLEVQQLIKKHEAVSFNNREKAMGA